ncbi:MAG TPA: DUF559 domain-containing protein [Polyangiaceae bacterium]|nr:DUF559 domain-containing protein [Polyangiaceae bacterium]
MGRPHPRRGSSRRCAAAVSTSYFAGRCLWSAGYIADLLAPSLGLVVEIDGASHRARQKADARRERALARAGYRVLRIDAELVMGDLDEAVARVRRAIEELRSRSP